jgi:nitrate reductase NapAB chaperone NapD
MPVCSYVVIPGAEGAGPVAERLSEITGCEVVRATNAEVLLLVTETATPSDDEELRRVLEGLPGIQAMLMAFGEVDPDTTERDPLGRRGRRHLPVLEGSERGRGGAMDRSRGARS